MTTYTCKCIKKVSVMTIKHLSVKAFDMTANRNVPMTALMFYMATINNFALTSNKLPSRSE